MEHEQSHGSRDKLVIEREISILSEHYVADYDKVRLPVAASEHHYTLCSDAIIGFIPPPKIIMRVMRSTMTWLGLRSV